MAATAALHRPVGACQSPLPEEPDRWSPSPAPHADPCPVAAGLRSATATPPREHAHVGPTGTTPVWQDAVPSPPAAPRSLHIPRFTPGALPNEPSEPGLTAEEVIARQQQEMQQLRDVAEHLRFRVEEQDFELRGLRDRMRAWGAAHDMASVSDNALCVVLEQLADAEKSISSLRAQAGRRDDQILRLQRLHHDQQVVEYVTQLEDSLSEARQREQMLADENKRLRDAEEAGRVERPASAEDYARLQQKLEVMSAKLAEKKRHIKDLEQLLRLHLTLRNYPAESRTAALMSGADETGLADVEPSLRPSGEERMV
eukprot:TRINITY_DN20184_c0_g1_i1.p1 TRINITY_DN20184_c0_g1~~TRINITY_DN20184_c0_g1_i1.p1  ORF type:complete len:331 (+),score=108.37 TRINITY_DN20184_c0_g1_i1:53-994(+)